MVDLSQYDNQTYNPGRPFLIQVAWFVLGQLVLRNPILPSSAVRRTLLKMFGAQIGQGVVIKPGVRIKFPWMLTVGDHSWLGEDCWIDNLAPVRIGRNACVSQAAYLCTGNHDWSDVKFRLITKPITIGDGAWVGARSVVAPGVTLGECSILTAGSTAKKNIPAYEIHDGCPAQFIRMRNFKHDVVSMQTALSLK